MLVVWFVWKGKKIMHQEEKEVNQVEHIIQALKRQLEQDILDAKRDQVLYHDAPQQTQEMIDWFEQFRRQGA